MEQTKTYYLISDAAKKVQVESHVLRYWEEELNMNIERNELGHRFYTEEDIRRFIAVKNLKEKGLQLKAIKLVLQDDESFEEELQQEMEERVKRNREERRETGMEIQRGAEKEENKNVEKENGNRENKEISGKKIISVISKTNVESDNKTDKVMRMQILLRQMIAEAVRDNNEEMCENIRDSIVKELDYQFRTLDEREEERAKGRDKKEEEHYQKIDELLRSRFKPQKEKKRKWFRAEK